MCVCCRSDGRFVPLPLREAKATPRRGQGNAATLIDEQVLSFAEAMAAYLRAVEREFHVKICRIALDAPSDPKKPGLSRRRCEPALDARRRRCPGLVSNSFGHRFGQNSIVQEVSQGISVVGQWSRTFRPGASLEFLPQ